MDTQLLATLILKLIDSQASIILYNINRYLCIVLRECIVLSICKIWESDYFSTSKVLHCSAPCCVSIGLSCKVVCMWV